MTCWRNDRKIGLAKNVLKTGGFSIAGSGF